MNSEYFNYEGEDSEIIRKVLGVPEMRSVPENYFDSLSENVMQNIAAVPDFEKVSSENPFKVPEGYFDSLPTVIQQRIVEGKNKSVFEEWIAALRFKPKYVFAVAAVTILLVFGIKYFTTSPVIEVQNNYLSCEEVKSSSYMNDMDETTLIDVLEQENKSTSKETVKEDNSIEQYLLDNNVDISQLEKRL